MKEGRGGCRKMSVIQRRLRGTVGRLGSPCRLWLSLSHGVFEDLEALTSGFTSTSISASVRQGDEGKEKRRAKTCRAHRRVCQLVPADPGRR